MVILRVWLKLDFFGIFVVSVGLWMGTVVGPLRVLYRILDLRAHRGIVAVDID